MFYIYILLSSSSDGYYVGHSSDPWQRLQQHQTNTGERYTGKHKDLTLKAVFEVSMNKGEADRIEKFMKRQESRKRIERLMDENFQPMGELAQLVSVRPGEINQRVVRLGGSSRGSRQKGTYFGRCFFFIASPAMNGKVYNNTFIMRTPVQILKVDFGEVPFYGEPH